MKTKKSIYILGFIILCVILFSIVSLYEPAPKWNDREKRTAVTLGFIRLALGAYTLNHDSYPKQLKDLYEAPSDMDILIWKGPYIDNEKMLKDEWDRPFKYEVIDSGRNCKVSSAGKDGQFDTSDDIYFSYEK